jgi:hypothetical protein
MAVALTITYDSLTTDEYDRIVKEKGFDEGRYDDYGCLFTWVEVKGNLLTFHEVWESEEASDAFTANVLSDVDVAEPVSVERTEVYHWIAPTSKHHG